MPSFKPRSLKEMDAILKYNTFDWTGEIVSSVLKEFERDRAVLVICETINYVKLIKEALMQHSIFNEKIITYMRSDEGNEDDTAE